MNCLQLVPLSQQIAKTARELRMALTEIHPAVHRAGLVKDAEVINRMKKDVDAITLRALNSSPVLDRIMVSIAEDLREQSKEVLSILVSEDPAAMTDDQLSEALLAAEMFVTRCRDYRDSRVAYLQLRKEHYHGMEEAAV